MGRKITIEPVTRVEGHGKVTIQLDPQGQVTDTRFHIVEFRGSSASSRAALLGGACAGAAPVRHLPGEPSPGRAKAMDVIVGAGTGDGLTPTAEKMRRLMHYGQMLQSHSLHFFTWSRRTFIRLIDAVGGAQRHRRCHTPQGPCGAGGDDAKVRPGDHSGYGRKEDTRHRSDTRRHQQVSYARGARRVPKGRRPAQFA